MQLFYYETKKRMDTHLRKRNLRYRPCRVKMNERKSIFRPHLQIGGSTMLYDIIIIGAGAAGLFAGASFSAPVKGLIIEKGPAPGQKIMMTGKGQCNLTHTGSIKDFIAHYGANGSRIRTILYQFNNRAVADFFQTLGVPLLEMGDGRVFPKSMRAADIVDALVRACGRNGFELRTRTEVTGLSLDPDSGVYTVRCGSAEYQAGKLIISTGGCSYPGTGSDGQFFSICRALGLELVAPTPALVPIYVQDYPYKELSGISFSHVTVSVHNRKKTAELKGDLLLTHDCFSGPVILNISRYAKAGDRLVLQYLPGLDAEAVRKELIRFGQGSPKSLSSILSDCLNANMSNGGAALPRRFLETLCRRCGVDPGEKFTRVSGGDIKAIAGLLAGDAFVISRTGGYNIAMVTSGGVSLDEVQLKTLEAKKYPGLYFAGEVLDADGDTGGYNLQFAFSCGHLAAGEAEKGI
jgi:predicted Rossmann fold flavoprotein